MRRKIVVKLLEDGNIHNARLVECLAEQFRKEVFENGKNGN